MLNSVRRPIRSDNQPATGAPTKIPMSVDAAMRPDHCGAGRTQIGAPGLSVPGAKTGSAGAGSAVGWRHEGLAGRRGPGGAGGRARREHAADARYAPGRGRHRAGTVTIHPGARTGAHHHGELESVIYVVRGRARMRWGERLEYTAEAGPGGFIFVPPWVPHQEINALDDEPLECVLTRSGQEPVVVNLDVEGVADPEHVPWVDPAHPG